MAATASDLYARDFYSWTQEQTAILRRAADARLNAPEGLDWQHLAEAVWEMGVSLELELYHRYIVLVAHLLKWRYQPSHRGPSWRAAVKEQRRRISRLLIKNPGVKPVRRDEFADAWPEARDLAIEETGMPPEIFPTTCPFTLEQVEDKEFWPED